MKREEPKGFGEQSVKSEILYPIRNFIPGITGILKLKF